MPHEVIKKVHRNSAFVVEGRQTQAAGNLVLTNERLVFLKQTALSDDKLKTFQKLAKEGTTDDMIRFALNLNKKNFQIPLSSITLVKTGVYSIFPMRPCTRIFYMDINKREKNVSFRFNPPLLKRLFELVPLATEWSWAIKKAVKAKKATIR